MLTEAPRRNTNLAVAVAADGRPKYLIAALAGMPPNTLGGIISGRFQASARQRQRLGETLGCSADELFPGGDDDR